MTKEGQEIAGKELETPEEAGSLPPLAERYAHLRERGADFRDPSISEKIRALRPSRRRFFGAILEADGPVMERVLRRQVVQASTSAAEQCQELTDKGLLSSGIRRVDGERVRFWRLAGDIDRDCAIDAFEAGNGGKGP
jgi:hypothetical protein